MAVYANENAYDAQIAALAVPLNVPIALVKAIIGVESNFIPSAQNLTSPGDVARGGSFGLMQVSLQTAKGYGYTGAGAGLLDPTTNLTYGMEFLANVLDEAGGDPATAASLYNGGHALGGSTFSNQSYVNQVMANYATYSGGSSGDDSGMGAGVAGLVLVIAAIGIGYALVRVLGR